MVKHLAGESGRGLGGWGREDWDLAGVCRHDSPHIELWCEDKMSQCPLVVHLRTAISREDDWARRRCVANGAEIVINGKSPISGE